MPRKVTRRFSLTVQRSALLSALQRLARVTPPRGVKPILSGVRLEASSGRMRLAATDLESSLFLELPAQGRLARCVVPCKDLAARVKAGRADVCALAARPQERKLVLNGGAVEHTLATLDPVDFPHLAAEPQGDEMHVRADSLRAALATAREGMARERTRYALDAVLLERDAQGTRLAATDGRRLVVCDLAGDGAFLGKALLPRNAVEHLLKLLDPRDAEGVCLYVTQPKESKLQDIHVAGRDWRLTCAAAEGSFPQYRDVIPRSASRFAVDRQAFIQTLEEVALATSLDERGVQVHLGPETLGLSAQTCEGGAASARLAATFLGGGDAGIVTGFYPPFLLDAARSLRGDTLIIDVAQNRRDKIRDSVVGAPAMFYAQDNLSTRWVVMPIALGLIPSPETLGSNYEAPTATQDSEASEAA